MSYRPDRFRRIIPRTAESPQAAAPAKPKTKRKPATWKPVTPLPRSTWQGETLTIILHIPPYEISPNGRAHWRTAAKLKKQAKGTAVITTLQVLAGRASPCPVGYSIAYYWPSTHRDDDNAIGSCKAYLDGICEAIGIDDKTLRFRALHHHADAKSPRVEILMHLIELLQQDAGPISAERPSARAGSQ